MPKGKRYFENGKIYHVILRRMGEELLFQDQDDYFRMIFYLYECNTPKNILLRLQREKRKAKKLDQVRGQTSAQIVQREPLVEILAFCLMPNHIHLLLRQLRDKGISKFIQKVASGYATYFKLKYEIQLQGHFFQDRFTAVPIKDEDQLKIVSTYIHTNPISLIEPKWSEFKVKDPQRAFQFLKEYRWSSYLDYIGQKNFPSLTQREILHRLFQQPRNIEKSIEEWIQFKHQFKEDLKELFCEG